ncbi:hypothetical protein M8J77_004128 [Diaphorina citri]|nr:hypothetical protein M8J77_004128 [Diaphorina citri]
MALRKMLTSVASPCSINLFHTCIRVCDVGGRGSGAGRGGGGGGSIRESGGKLGEMAAAKEDEYFYKKQKEQLAALRDHTHKEIAFHKEQIKRHKEAIERHQKVIKDSEHHHK